MGLLVHTLVFILVVWGMMNVKNEAPNVIPVQEEEESGQYIVKPPRMVDIVPEPGMEDPAFVDTGLELESMDLNSM